MGAQYMTTPSTTSSPDTAPGPVELLQRLIRFDTTNPPGNEGECLWYIHDLLAAWGFSVRMLGPTPERLNLVARLEGRGDAPPLLMYGHVDVVTTEDQEWTHPPFEGRQEDGCVWGRGALDMKGGIVMMLSALLRAMSEGETPGDVVLALVSDEEAGGEHGAKSLVDNHPELFDGVRNAIGEFGGFSFDIGRRRFYAIMAAEKQACWLRLTMRGRSGHGSLSPPYSNEAGAMKRLSQVLERLEKRRLPVHVTPVARRMAETIAENIPFPASLVFRLIHRTALTGPVLKLMGERGSTFAPLFRNTVTPTVVRGGRQINVTPGEIVLDLDGRLLPGCDPDDLISEVHDALGPPTADGVEIEVVRWEPGPPEADLDFFPALERVMLEMDPEGVPVPILLPGATDARHFARLGIQTYGFLPMRLPEGFNFSQLVHGPDERIPVDALHFGAEAIYRLIRGGQ